jgi:hypothetical protein
MEDWKYIAAQSLTLFLFLFSEYLGVSKQNKSNAIIELLMCALNTKRTDDTEVPLVILTPPASQKPPSS